MEKQGFPMTSAPSGLTLARPDDWHVHLRDGPALAAVAAHTARVFGRAIVMPNLQAARDDRRGGRRLPRADPGRVARRHPLHAADDALPHRQHGAGRDRTREGIGVRARGQVLPGRGDDQLGLRRDRARSRLSGAGGDGACRRGALAAWRGHRRGGRHVRPRARVRRHAARAHRARLPRPQDRAGAHHDARGRRVRPRGADADRRDDHAAASAVVAQRAVRRAASGRTTTACRS